MNKAAGLVTESLLGVSFKTIRIGGKYYTIYEPTVKVMTIGLREWAKLGVKIEGDELSFGNIPDNAPIILKGLCHFIVGRKRFSRIRAKILYWKLMDSSTNKEMLHGAKTAVDLIGVNDFFVCAALLMNVVKIAATPK